MTALPGWLGDTVIREGRCHRCGALVPTGDLAVAAWLLGHYKHADTADVLVRAWALRALATPAQPQPQPEPEPEPEPEPQALIDPSQLPHAPVELPDQPDNLILACR